MLNAPVSIFPGSESLLNLPSLSEPQARFFICTKTFTNY